MEKRQMGWMIVFLTLAISVMLFILYQSMQIGDHSALLSQNVTSRLNNLLTALHLDGIISEWLVRKLAHLTEYAAFGFFWCFFLRFRNLDEKTGKLLCMTLLAGGILAALDETIQHFTPGRNGQIRDVLLDEVGVTIGIAAVLMILLVSGMVRKR